MFSQTWKIFKYETFNLLRSKWVILFGAFFLVSAEILLRFGGHPGKTIVSLMNLMLVVIPLISLILGITYFYQSREFMELLLSQPITRSSIFLGKILGLAFTLSLVLVLGLALPFAMQNLPPVYLGHLLVLLSVGVAFIFIFVSIAFLMASFYEDRVKGLGSILLLWLFLAVVYDAALLFLVYALEDYPLEKPLIVLVMLNPIDLGRILILLRLDIAALMGYTGASFRKFFGSNWGMTLASISLFLWTVILWDWEYSTSASEIFSLVEFDLVFRYKR